MQIAVQPRAWTVEGARGEHPVPYSEDSSTVDPVANDVEVLQEPLAAIGERDATKLADWRVGRRRTMQCAQKLANLDGRGVPIIRLRFDGVAAGQPRDDRP